MKNFLSIQNLSTANFIIKNQHETDQFGNSLMGDDFIKWAKAVIHAFKNLFKTAKMLLKIGLSWSMSLKQAWALAAKNLILVPQRS